MLSILPINLMCYKIDRFTILKAPNPIGHTAHSKEETKDF